MVNYSEKMQAYMDAHNINPKQVFYLTIARDPLDRILNGSKKVEFRDYSDHYIAKLFHIDGQDILDPKPYTHLLLQNGYTAKAKRALVEIADIRLKEPEDRDPQSEVGKLMYEQAEIEGFEIEDPWIGIALGRVCISE